MVMQMQTDAEMDANVDTLLQDLDPGPSEPNPGQHLDPIPNPHQGQVQDPLKAMQPEFDVHNNPVWSPHLLYSMYSHIWQ